MSQAHAMLILQMLARDAEFRRRFERDPARLLLALSDKGLALTRTEMSELVTLDTSRFGRKGAPLPDETRLAQ